MNSENNSLARTYFVGGPPRVGKTILSYLLAEKIKGHVVSTDAICMAAKKATTDKESDLFILNKTESLSEEEWLKNHRDFPEKTIEFQNRESLAFWPSLVSFCNTFCEDRATHVVEGVALLPSKISDMTSKPQHIFFVGNTSEKHAESMLDFSKKFPEWDWMGACGYSEEKIRAMATFVREMSLYFKSEAENYGFSYYEIDDSDFQGSIVRIIEEVTKS